MDTITESLGLIRAPLRNRLRTDLAASVADVWALVGNPARMSEYSAGVERAEVRTDPLGAITGYALHFRPMQPGEPGIVAHDTMVWYEPGRGWASRSDRPELFGLSDDLHVLTVEPSREGTLLTWDSHYQAQDLDATRAHYHDALSDIGQNLLARFGGRLIHVYATG